MQFQTVIYLKCPNRKNSLSKLQFPISNYLGIKVFQGFKGIISNNVVCRTAPATGGLLMIARTDNYAT